ncbi:hypothetical protein [Halofilum ochraceum]|uniref:hypothetical protein n=1 Tax=Halofilum ochraceum TaxID=1611323 RepID=UPI0011131595|nr:hypothetical protein [Halofilum ochraceum]
MTTIPIGHVGARIALVAVTAAVAAWLYAQAGEPSLAVVATGGLAVASAIELLYGRHLLELGMAGDELVIGRRRVWQRAAQGREERIPRDRVQSLVIVRSTRPGSRGPDTHYRLELRMTSGDAHALVAQPYRSADSAAATAEKVGRVLDLEPEWREESS